jgi:hypothetical protein
MARSRVTGSIDLGQGYLLGRPDDAVAAAKTIVRPGLPLPSPAVSGRRAT